MDIAPTTDVDGLADMKSTAAGGSADYNIQVDSAGNYPLSFRVAGATGQIRVYKGSTLLGSANAAQTSWLTVSTTVSLAAGTQTLHVVLTSNAQRLNWMEFVATNGTPSVPSGLSATAGGTQVVLNWSTCAGATNYNVKRSTTNSGPYITIASPTTTSYTNTGLTIGATYYYVVSAVNAAGESTNSIQVSATTVFPPANLALNKPVTVSSVEGTSYPGTNAVDGNTGTRWSSAFSDPQWIYVDLQATYSITRVKLNWEAACGKSYQIQVSTNALSWATIYSTTAGASGVADLTGLSGTGRYVRMYGTARATGYGYSLWEFEVYGTVPVPTAGNNGPIFAGMTLNLTASTVPGATYSWSGPNGFCSTEQNCWIVNATTNATGIYSVRATIGACTSVAAATTATVNPPMVLSLQPSGNGFTLAWPGGTLQSATNLNGEWFEVYGATNFYQVTPTAARQFYRIKLQ
jgi:hypothetical protein